MTTHAIFASTVLAAAALLAGCGDDGTTATTDARIIDAGAIDAASCNLTGYPETVRPISIEMTAQTQLALDGTGTRCEQIVRAVLGPNRPPELAQMDVASATSTCTHDGVTNREIVRLRLPEYGGLPIYWPVQDALIHVDVSNKVVFLAGDYVPAGHAPIAGCLGGPALSSELPGRPLEYEKFAACVPRGPGSYPIAADDVLELGEEGVYLDGDGGLRRVRAIDVYLTPAHVNAEITNSDAYCCSGPGVDHCVGKRLFLDALTGETIAQDTHCHTC